VSVEPKPWTVIGFWYEDKRVVTGVVEGSHQVSGGDVSAISEQGLWADSVTAATAEEAERLATAPDDGEEDV
jgi:hypothetical protein